MVKRNLLAVGVGLLAMITSVAAMAEPVFSSTSPFPVNLTLLDVADQNF